MTASVQPGESVQAGESVQPAEKRAVATPRILVAVLLVVFAVLYAYDVWTALQNLLTVPGLVTRNYDFYRANGLTGLIKPVPYVQLVIAVLAPIVAYVVVLRVTRGRVLWQRLLAFVVGWAAISAVGAAVSAYVSTRYGL